MPALLDLAGPSNESLVGGQVAALRAGPGKLVCANGSISATVSQKDTGGSHDALLYIVVVLSFYAFAMIVLMVKYIRRENQEAELTFYYTEFIKREKFQHSTYKTQREVDAVRRTLETLETLETVYKPAEYRVTAV